MCAMSYAPSPHGFLVSLLSERNRDAERVRKIALVNAINGWISRRWRRDVVNKRFGGVPKKKVCA